MHQIDIILSNFVSSLGKDSKKDKSEMFFLHYPLLPQHGTGMTLDDIAERFDITRESVRQSIIKLCQSIRDNEEMFGVLSTVIDEIRSVIPASVSYIDSLLISRGIICSPISLNLIKIFKRMCDDLTLRHVSRYNTIEDSKSEDMSSLIYSYFTKKVVHNGIVSESELMGRFHDIVNSPSTLMSIIKESAPNLIEVIPQHYYCGDVGRNRLVNRLMSLSQVYKTVDISLLKNAIERSWSKDINKEKEINSNHQVNQKNLFTQVPSADAIIGVIEDLNLGKCQGNLIYFDSEPSKIEVSALKWAEVEVMRLFSSQKSPLREKVIETALLKINPKKRYACMQMLNNSHMIAKQERGLYTLLGQLKTGL